MNQTLEQLLRSLPDTTRLKDNTGEVWAPSTLIEALHEGEANMPEDFPFGITSQSEVTVADGRIRLVKPDGYIDTGEALYTFVDEEE